MATISGQILDTSGAGVPYAQIQVFMSDGITLERLTKNGVPTSAIFITDSQGNYGPVVGVSGSNIVRAIASGYTFLDGTNAIAPFCLDDPSYALVEPDRPYGTTFFGLTAPILGVTQDLPLAKSIVVINDYDNPPINKDRKFMLEVQGWSGSTPARSVTNNPSNILLPAFFAAHRGQNSGTFITAMNAMVTWDSPKPSGTINTNGTMVTWVSGTTFINAFANASIAINNTSYTIASVTDSTHLVLTTSAGVQNGVGFVIGGESIVELDINNYSGVDENVSDVLKSVGLIIASGGTNKAGNALFIDGGVFGTQGNFAGSGIIIKGVNQYGIFGYPGGLTTSQAFDMSNGATGTSFLRGGSPTLIITPTGAGAALQIQPGADLDGNIELYGSNAANSLVRWFITQDGTASFKYLNVTAGSNSGIGSFGVLAGVNTQVVSNTRVTASSVIIIWPINAAAASLMGSAASLFVSTQTAGTSFTVKTGNSTNFGGTELFSYLIMN